VQPFLGRVDEIRFVFLDERLCELFASAASG